MSDTAPTSESNDSPRPHRRRPRYAGKYPRQFAHKYKEHNPEAYPETVAKVIAGGKTPAGTHRPIMVDEILGALQPQPGQVAVDATLGYGGHARAILERIQPGGRLIGLDVDPVELPKTESRLRSMGYGPDVFRAHRSNFAGLPKILAAEQLAGVDMILADLGISSMQIDDPSRGFSVKASGPLDMRMNPHRSPSAAELLARCSAVQLAKVLRENADEPRADLLGSALAGRKLSTTRELGDAVRRALPPGILDEEKDDTIRRVFQAVRIAVNEEFSALEMLLRVLPGSLRPGGRVAILTFHSGEDRRVKKAFEAGLRDGIYAEIAREVTRASVTERRDNPRSSSAKLRWAIRAA